MANDPKIRAAVAAASKSRGNNFAGAIAALGERLDEVVSELEQLRTEVAELAPPPVSSTLGGNPAGTLGHGLAQ